MDDALAYLVGRLLRILVLAFGLWMAIETLEAHPAGSEADHSDRGEAEGRVAGWGAALADP